MPATTETATPSVRDELIAAWKEHTSEERTPKEQVPGATDRASEPTKDLAKETPPKATDQTADPTKDLTKDAADAAKNPAQDGGEKRSRDEQGRFRSEQAANKADDKQQKTTTIEPPVRWTKERKEAFLKLPPDAQTVLVELNREIEGHLTKQSQDIASSRQAHEAIEKLLAPRRDQWRMAGLTDAAALEQLLSGFEFSMKDPVGFINWIANARKVDLSKIAPAAPLQAAPTTGGAPASDAGPPAIPDALARYIVSLEQRLGQIEGATNQFSNHMTAQQRAELMSAERQIMNELQAFETAKDAAGNPKYPFFHDVRNEMGRLVGSGLANSLDEAYDKAAHSLPAVRQKILESQQLAWQRQQEQRLKDDAAKAKAAATSLGSGAPATTPRAADSNAGAPRPGSVRDDLMKAFAQHTGGGRL